MTGPVKYDSLSKCRQTDSLYDLIQNPNARQVKKLNPSSSIDTIQSAPQNVKKEIANLYKTNGLQLSHESFVAAAQVGKYIFLSIMVPVYLCTYGIPKWIICQALPNVLNKCHLSHIANFFLNPYQKTSDMMCVMINQLIGQSLSFLNDANHAFIKYSQFIFNKIKSNVFKTYHLIQATFKKRFENIQTKIKSTCLKTIEMTISFYNSTKIYFKQLTTYALLQWINKRKHTGSQKKHSLFLRFHSQLNQKKLVIQRIKNQLLKNTLDIFLWLAQCFKKIIKLTQKFWHFLKPFILYIYLKVQLTIKKTALKTTQSSTALFTYLKKYLALVISYFRAKSTLPIKCYLFIRHRRVLHNVINAFALNIKKTRLKHLKPKTPLVTRVSRLKLTMPCFKKNLMTFPQTVKTNSYVSYNFIWNATQKGLSKIRMMSVWLKVLIQVGQLHTKASADAFISWMNQEQEY